METYKYITVLNLDKNNIPNYWKAIQWSNSLDSILEKTYYTAGNNKNFPKSINDKECGQKTVVEIIEGRRVEGEATIIKLANPQTQIF